MCLSSQNGQILYSLSDLVSGLNQAIDIYSSIRLYVYAKIVKMGN